MGAPSAVSGSIPAARRAPRSLAARIGIILLCLVVYRLGTYIPLPGVTPIAVEMERVVHGLERFSVFTLGVIPYLSASLLMQLVLWGWPGAAALRETAGGRRRINGYIRVLTLALAVLQAVGVTIGIVQFLTRGSEPPPGADMFVRIVMIATLTAGAIAVMWLCEQITERCAVDGAMVIMLVNAAAGMPVAIFGLVEKMRWGALAASSVWPPAVLLVVLTAAMVFFESAWRRLPVEGGTGGELPLPLNGSGVLALLLVPQLAAVVPAVLLWLFPGEAVPGTPLHDAAMAALYPFHPVHIGLSAAIILPVAFYARTNGFNPAIAAAYLKWSGGRFPGVAVDKAGAYAAYVLARISAAGALYLAAVYAAVQTVGALGPLQGAVSAMSLLIAVRVTLDLRGAGRS